MKKEEAKSLAIKSGKSQISNIIDKIKLECEKGNFKVKINRSEISDSSMIILKSEGYQVGGIIKNNNHFEESVIVSWE